MRMKLACSVAFAALMIPGAAFAQSTGSVEAEDGTDVVVTGSRGAPSVDGIQTPDSPRARAVITQELIERRAPGQTIFDTINLVPGVSFTNSDPYGSSGGQLRIRGFSSDRVSATFDGIPLNDSGNYAIYTNQQLDPELIDQVNVNFGSTDVDSPTASAAGGTVNYRSAIPTDEMHVIGVFSHGTFDRNRVFGMLNTGEFTKFGTKMWIAASSDRYDQYRGPGEIYKQQYNFKVYQPLGGSDFISLAGHYNQNRNSSYSNPTIANINTVAGNIIPAAATPGSPVTVDLTRQQFDTVFDSTSSAYLYDYACVRPAATGGPGRQDDTAGQCFNSALTAINPSNTGNLRVNSRFSLTDKLIFTFDGAYSFTRANGGGTTVFSESNSAANGRNQYNLQYQRVGAGIAAGADLNGDGDQLDNVRVYFPSNTRTQRFTAIAGLRYDLDDDNLIRLAYTWDRARHRQTGEAGLLSAQNDPFYEFSALDGRGSPIVDAAGNVINKRNRLSYAILHQISGEYRGQFFDDKLKVALGVRAPFFRRNLTNYCFTIRGNSSDAYCTSESVASVAANPATASFAAPYNNRIKTYSAVLPNVGLTYDIVGDLSVFASYSKGYSVPKTDNLYGYDDRVLTPAEPIAPEKTDSFDVGVRYSSRIVQAQIAGWYTYYKNRIISSLTDLGDGSAPVSVDRNVGAVKLGGVDASIAVRPVKWLSLYGFGSYLDSELQDDAINPATGLVVAATRGKFVVETPKWQYGGRAQADFGIVSAGIEAKHTGDRWITDINDLKSAGYTVVNADARLSLTTLGLERTYLQLNITNLLKERYFGNLSTTTSFTTGNRLTFGAPRTFIGSIHFEF